MEIKTLGELCNIVSGGTPLRSKPEYWNNGTIPWIKIGDIKEKYINNADEYITKAGLDGSSAKMLPKGTILYTIFATLGEVGILEIDASTNQAIAGLTIKDKNQILSEYLYHYLKSKKRYVKTIGRGVAQSNINMSILKSFQVPLPSPSTQNRIIDVLDKITNIIEYRQQELQKLDDLIKARFVELFGDININDKHWESEPLGELCTIVRGGSPRPIEQYLGGDVPWIKIGDATVGDNIYLSSTKEHIIQEGVKKSRLVKAGSLIFANCGVSLGFARIITFDGCIHDGWLAMEDIDERLDKVFLLQALNQMTEHFRAIAPAGTQPNLNTAIMKVYRQVIPPIELQRNFIRFADQIDKSKATVQKALDETQLLFDSLMQQYFG